MRHSMYASAATSSAPFSQPPGSASTTPSTACQAAAATPQMALRMASNCAPIDCTVESASVSIGVSWLWLLKSGLGGLIFDEYIIGAGCGLWVARCGSGVGVGLVAERSSAVLCRGQGILKRSGGKHDKLYH